MATRKTARRTRQLVKQASSGSRKREMTGTNNDARKKDIEGLRQRVKTLEASTLRLIQEVERLSHDWAGMHVRLDEADLALRELKGS